ncbi:MAG: LysM domain-containing protein [Anaerolineae bacterium]
MIRRAFPSALLAAGLAVALFLALHVTGHAQPGQCGQTYTVRRDDTLARIAHLLNVSEAELRTANPATIPANGQLYVGQVLCLPNDTVSLYVDGGASIPTAQDLAVGWSSPRLAIEATYQFAPATADEENQWNLVTSRGRFRGADVWLCRCRATIPSRPSPTPKQLRAAIDGEPAPVLLAVRNSDELADLHAGLHRGPGAPHRQLARSPTACPSRLTPNATCNGAPVEQVLGGPRIARPSICVVWLESPGSMRWPMQISHISYHEGCERQPTKPMTATLLENADIIALALVPTARPQTPPRLPAAPAATRRWCCCSTTAVARPARSWRPTANNGRASEARSIGCCAHGADVLDDPHV